MSTPSPISFVLFALLGGYPSEKKTAILVADGLCCIERSAIKGLNGVAEPWTFQAFGGPITRSQIGEDQVSSSLQAK